MSDFHRILWFPPTLELIFLPHHNPRLDMNVLFVYPSFLSGPVSGEPRGVGERYRYASCTFGDSTISLDVRMRQKVRDVGGGGLKWWAPGQCPIAHMASPPLGVDMSEGIWPDLRILRGGGGVWAGIPQGGGGGGVGSRSAGIFIY